MIRRPVSLLHVAALACAIAGASSADAQPDPTPVTREDAVATAIARGARLGLARADTAVAFAQLLTARAWQNPTFSMTYSKSPPTFHYIAEVPFDLPHQRSARIGSARASRAAAQFRFAFERAAAALDADTTYTRAIAARERAQLSRRNAEAADSLRRMVIVRRDARDASDLDVALATVTAGQAWNVANADSLSYFSVVLDLQSVMGLDAGGVAIVPTDSLTSPPDAGIPDSGIPDSGLGHSGTPLQIAAARSALEAARLAVQLQRRSIFSAPSLIGGVENGDPDYPGLLPTFGLALALPILNRNRGPIAQATAEQERARAELTLAEVQSRAGAARARRTLTIALAKVERDRLLVTAAEQVASMSLIAYREGASSLPNVLEAQRNAREVLAQYVEDLASAWIAAAQLRVLTLSVAEQP